MIEDVLTMWEVVEVTVTTRPDAALMVRVDDQATTTEALVDVPEWLVDAGDTFTDGMACRAVVLGVEPLVLSLKRDDIDKGDFITADPFLRGLYVHDSWIRPPWKLNPIEVQRRFLRWLGEERGDRVALVVLNHSLKTRRHPHLEAATVLGSWFGLPDDRESLEAQERVVDLLRDVSAARDEDLLAHVMWLMEVLGLDGTRQREHEAQVQPLRDAVFDLTLRLVNATWHDRHETLVDWLEMFARPASVPTLLRLSRLHGDDEVDALARRATRAIGNVAAHAAPGSSADRVAREALESLTGLPNVGGIARRRLAI